MNNLFAWASIGENGKATGGKPGDQTGREVKVANYYNFGQDKCVRFKSVDYGRKAGVIAKKLAKCESIGYNQSQRGTLFSLASECGWKIEPLLGALKEKKVNCDCSSFVSTVINLAFEKRIVPCCTTSTLWENCEKTKKFKCMDIDKAEKNFHKGDMPIKAGKHVIINV